MILFPFIVSFFVVGFFLFLRWKNQKPIIQTILRERTASRGSQQLHETQMLRFPSKGINYGEFDESQVKVETLPCPGAVVLFNLLSVDECEQMVDLAEEMGFSQAPLRNLNEINSPNATLNRQSLSIRNSQRVLFDAPWESMSKEIHERLLSFLPSEVEIRGEKWEVDKSCCINLRWRFNRYNEGNYFRPHFDAGFVYSETRKTLLTFILYLNEGFEGGETAFLGENRTIEPFPLCKVTPKTGSVLVFFKMDLFLLCMRGVRLVVRNQSIF